MKRFKYWILLFVLLCSCASQKIISQNVSRERLFPDGVYQHQVKLTIVKTDHSDEKSFSFSGIVKLDPAQVQVVVLSHFGTTVAKMIENRKSGEFKTEIYIDAMKKFEPKMKDYYSILRLLLLAKSSSPEKNEKGLKWVKTDETGFPTELITEGLDQNATFYVTKFDKNHYPEEMKIVHPKFSVEIQVSGYEI